MIRKDQEKGVREAFRRALEAKTKAPAVKEKAEMQFFGTLVRIHRAGEGALIPGLNPVRLLNPLSRPPINPWKQERWKT